MTTRAEPPAGQPISGPHTDPLTDKRREKLYTRLTEMFPDADPADFRPKPCTPGHEGSVWVPGSGPDIPEGRSRGVPTRPEGS